MAWKAKEEAKWRQRLSIFSLSNRSRDVVGVLVTGTEREDEIERGRSIHQSRKRKVVT